MAVALTALGFRTTVDDIMFETDCDPAFIVNNGLTLAQTYGLADRYIAKKEYEVSLRMYHFDEACVTLEGFWSAVCEHVKDMNSVIVANFHSGIAHGKEHGGGHFAMIDSVHKAEREVIMSDVHPLKYGRYWTTPVELLFKAMVDRDSDSNRARGLLIFFKGNRPIDSPGLNGVCRTVSWRQPVLDLGEKWCGREYLLQRFVPKEVEKFNTAVNMTGAAAVALALHALTPEHQSQWSVREVIKQTGSSYTRHLKTFMSVEELQSVANKLPDFTTRLVPLQQINDIHKGGYALGTLLHKASATNAVVLVRFDVNVAYGFEVLKKKSSEAGVLCHGANKWAAVAGIDGNRVIIADTHPISMGRFWWCGTDQLFASMRAVHTKACLVIERDLVVSDIT